MIDKIGSYRVVRQLGEGGMGVVFEAINDQIGRRAAIKVLHKEVSQNPELLARFYNEARASNLVSHASIVDVYEIGQLPDGRAYIVMQFLEGESLGDRLVRLGGRMPVSDAIRLTRQIASGMAAAHAKGIIHRDLKPDNVMVVADPEAVGGERVKIVDFGIAKLIAPLDESGAQFKTRAGTVLGTPAYMAPEQCRGADGVTVKSDVYALGAMLYEFLVGRTVFTASGTGDMLAKQIYEQPLPLWELDPSLPADLVALVHAMLAKTPATRPSMIEVAAQLTKLGAPKTDETATVDDSLPLNDKRTRALYASPGVAARSRAVSRRGLILGGGALLFVAVVAGGVFMWGHRTDKGMLVPHHAALTQQSKTTEPSATAQPAVIIHWSIVTEPPGAEILRATDRETLGFTPWRYQRVAGQGTMPLLLRLAGHVEQSLALPLSKDESRQVVMTRQPSAPPTPPEPPSRTKRERGIAKRRPGNLTDADIKVVK